jgi:uncharacterized membrane protein YgcG
MSVSEDIHAIPRLVGDAMEQMGKLIQNEAQLARAEVSEKVKQAGIGAAYLAGAAVLAIPVLVILLMALALWLSSAFELTPALAHLLAGAGGAAVAAILGVCGMTYLKPENLQPTATMLEIKRDVETAKELAR